VNTTFGTHPRGSAAGFDRPMLLVAATLALLCLSNAVLGYQALRFRAELLTLRSTVSAGEAGSADQASQAQGRAGNVIVARGK
jgi:hypothetical protein